MRYDRSAIEFFAPAGLYIAENAFPRFRYSIT